MADYGVNIAVAVKNTQAITKLSRDTDLLGQKIKNVNDALEKFGDLNGDGELSQSEISEAGSARHVYLFILISHIALAAISLPFILLTFCYGFTHHFDKHRSLSKKIFPIWLYVAITGPVVYFLLQPYY